MVVSHVLECLSLCFVFRAKYGLKWEHTFWNPTDFFLFYDFFQCIYGLKLEWLLNTLYNQTDLFFCCVFSAKYGLNREPTFYNPTDFFFVLWFFSANYGLNLEWHLYTFYNQTDFLFNVNYVQSLFSHR